MNYWGICAGERFKKGIGFVLLPRPLRERVGVRGERGGKTKTVNYE
jgi:hypothetical protein